MMKATFLLVVLVVLLVPVSAQAVMFGWHELPDGGIEYLVQVEPDLLDSFHKEGFISDIPLALRDIRRIRITVGEGRLPNQGDVNGPQVAATQRPQESAGTVPSAQQSQTGGMASESAANGAAASSDLESKSPSAAAEAWQEVPRLLQFFQSGSAKHIHPTETIPNDGSATSAQPPADRGAVHAGGAYDATEQPRLNENELPKVDRDASSAEGVTAGFGSATDNHTAGATSGPAKPWLPLMAALLCLFASIGANVYLVWIHLGIRTKYRALVRPGSAL